MVDSAIVTMVDKSNTVIGDFELPVKITIKELGEKIAALLKAMDDEKYMCVNSVKIEYKNRRLDESDTLYQNFIWDGSIIKVVY